MFRLSKLSDYALVVLATLARAPSFSLTAREVARRAGLPLPTACKLLQVLSQAGLLTAQRGVRGGYRLARAPEQLTVAEALAVLEGPPTLTACGTAPTGVCALEPVCQVRGHWHRLNRALLAALEGLTLADLARPTDAPPASPPALASLSP